MSFAPFNVTTAPDGRLLTNFGIDSSEAPWSFRMLAEPDLTNELNRFADAKTSITSGVRVDSVWFQPASSEDDRSQDRIYDGICEGMEQRWSIIGVFDGMQVPFCQQAPLILCCFQVMVAMNALITP
jgi:hypothetical protein